MPESEIAQDKIDEVLGNVFFQRDAVRHAELIPPPDQPQPKLVHYTSAQTAYAILTAKSEEDRCLWLRNATEMNDFSEVDYGLNLLRQAFSDDALANSFLDACNAVVPGHFQSVFKAIGDEASVLKLNTYLLSLSAHAGLELEMGLLSMWRAYGGDANVCLVFNVDAFANPQDAYDVVIAPVDYRGLRGIVGEVTRMRDAIIEYRDDLKKIDPNLVSFNMKYALDIMLLSTKHPGFAEEKEWRIIYRPPGPPAEPDVPSKIVCVNGVVQSVFYLPMRDIPEKKLLKANLNEILDSIIIGPTPNPDVVVNAFVRMLRAAGMQDAERRVKFSGIPLRR
ncbi:DUF2971 domain-containing protein [uncultured Sphingomonas sp.]|uniref:DUF2971 domain-containing protein n=1 Tax=uncultured Sphingomonas sp. TaxID=158754 RepID=UPI0025DC6F4C|nr:DUF2971 domain-containing protein [uncultured Sphingomonas sp.]